MKPIVLLLAYVFDFEKYRRYRTLIEQAYFSEEEAYDRVFKN